MTPIRPRVSSTTSSSVGIPCSRSSASVRRRSGPRSGVSRSRSRSWKTTSAPSARGLDVELDEVGAELDRPLERRQRVLRARPQTRRGGRSPTSSDERRDELEVDRVDDRSSAAASRSSGSVPAHGDAAQAGAARRGDPASVSSNATTSSAREAVAERLQRAQVSLRIGLAARHVVGRHERADDAGEAGASSTGSISRRYAPETTATGTRLGRVAHGLAQRRRRSSSRRRRPTVALDPLVDERVRARRRRRRASRR